MDPHKNESVFVGKDSSSPTQSHAEPKQIHVPNPAPATCGTKRKQPESIQKVQIVGYRCAPHRVPKVVESLSSLQKSYVNKMGFQSLLSMAKCELPKGLTVWLIKNVNCDKGTLEVGGKSIPIKQLTKKLLGVPCGTMQVPTPMDVEDILKDRFSNRGKGKSVNVVINDMINETDEEIFCKSFMLVMFCLYLAPNTTQYVNRSLLSTVSDIKNIKEMNWCDFISDYLLQGIREYKTSQASNVQVRGCVHILDLIYVDFVHAPSILTPRGIPRLEHITTAHLKSLSSLDVKSSMRNHTETQYGRLKVRNLSETLYDVPNGDETHGFVGDMYKETSVSKENLSKPYQNDVHSESHGDAETGKAGDEMDPITKLIDKFNKKLQSRRVQLVKYSESWIASFDAKIIAEFRDELMNSFSAQAQDEDAAKVNEEDHVHVDEDDPVRDEANEEDYVPAKDNEEDIAPISSPIGIGDPEGTSRSEDAQTIHPLIQPIPGGERFHDPGSVPVGTKQRPKREKPLDYEPAQICFCKAKAPRLTSWSDINPGRRYYKCGANTGLGCTFWKWADPKIPPFLNQLICDLRDNVRELKNENANLKMQASKEEEKEQVIEEHDAMKLVRKMDTEMAALAARIDKECKYKKMFYVLAIIFAVWLVVLESVSFKYIFE